MSKKVKEPFLATRTLNFLLGVAILVLVFLVFFQEGGTEFYEILIFALAAVENFIGATISFSGQKKVRGNIYAIVSAVFFVFALVLALRYFIFV